MKLVNTLVLDTSGIIFLVCSSPTSSTILTYSINGNTSAFGAEVLGSNPNRSSKLESKARRFVQLFAKQIVVNSIRFDYDTFLHIYKWMRSQMLD